jgi:nucleoid DNA-binding protein
MVTKYMAQAVKERIPDIDLKTVQMVCETFCETILAEVKGGNDVILRSFVKFKRVVRNPRNFTNVNSGKVTSKPKRYALSISVMAGTKVVFDEMTVNPDDEGTNSKTTSGDTTNDEDEDEVPKKRAPKKKVDETVDKPARKKAAPKKKVVADKETSDVEKEISDKSDKEISDKSDKEISDKSDKEISDKSDKEISDKDEGVKPARKKAPKKNVIAESSGDDNKENSDKDEVAKPARKKAAPRKKDDEAAKEDADAEVKVKAVKAVKAKKTKDAMSSDLEVEEQKIKKHKFDSDSE